MRGDLDRTAALATVEHRPKVALQVDCLGSRATRGSPLTGNTRFHGAKQPTALAGGFQQRAHEMGARRLAVGARDADDVQACGRLAVETCSERSHRSPGRAHQQLGNTQSKRALDDQRRRPRRHRLRGEIVAVALVARNAEEQRADLHTATVIGQPAYLGRIRDRRKHPQSGQLRGRQLVQPHGFAPSEFKERESRASARRDGPICAKVI